MEQMPWIKLAGVACQRFKVEVKQNKCKEKNSFKRRWKIAGEILNVERMCAVEHRTTQANQKSYNQINVYIFIGSD